MSDVKWIKITTDLFDDEKIILIESLPDSYAIIVVWIKLLCLAGKMNNSGVFLINDSLPYTEKMLATIFRMKESTVSLALQTFEQFGMIEKVDGVITIPNWGKHQSLEKLEARKKYQREYHREYRKRQKLLAEGSKDALDDESKSLRKCLRKDDVNTLDKNKNKKEDIDKESHHTQGKVPCGSLGNVYLTPEQNDELYKLIPSQADGYIERFGRYKSMKTIESHDDYAWIRGWMDEDEAIVKERRKQEAERWDAIVEEEANEQP